MQNSQRHPFEKSAAFRGNNRRFFRYSLADGIRVVSLAMPDTPSSAHFFVFDLYLTPLHGLFKYIDYLNCFVFGAPDLSTFYPFFIKQRSFRRIFFCKKRKQPKLLSP